MTIVTEEARERLVGDFKKVIRDAEALLRATADQTGDAIDAVRMRAEESLRDARNRLDEVEGDFLNRTKAAAKATDELVHERPWQAVGLAAAVGFLLGMLTGRH